MIHKDYCSRCKRKNIPLIKYSKGSSGAVQYYQCRDCANKRTKAYYNTPKGRAAYKRVREKEKNNAESQYKQSVRVLVNTAVISGRLTKPKRCSECDNAGRIEGHHSDYDKPLEVMWLCTACHAEMHKSMEQAKN